MKWSDNITGWLGFNRKVESELVRVGPDATGANALIEQASADPDWILAKRYIRERLVAMRRSLEAIGLEHEKTEGLRYAILELEGVLNFRKPSKMAESASE